MSAKMITSDIVEFFELICLVKDVIWIQECMMAMSCCHVLLMLKLFHNKIYFPYRLIHCTQKQSLSGGNVPALRRSLVEC